MRQLPSLCSSHLIKAVIWIPSWYFMTKACQSFRSNSDNNYVAGFSIKAKHLWMLLQSVMGSSANTVNDKKVVSFINGSVLTPLNRYLSFFFCFSLYCWKSLSCSMLVFFSNYITLSGKLFPSPSFCFHSMFQVYIWFIEVY